MNIQFAKLSFIALLLITIASCGDDIEFEGGNCLPANLQSNIIGYYTFGNGSLLDGSGYNADLTNNTQAVSFEDRSMNPNCAFKFDNTGTQEEFLSSAVSNQLNGLNSFSISAWYMPHPSNSGFLQGMVSRNDTIGTSCPDRRGEWSLSLYDCKKAVFGHDNSVWTNLDINQQLDCDEQVSLFDNIWHHAVAVKNGNDYQIYYNGMLSESDSGDANCSNSPKSRDIGDIFIGKNFTGLLDDIIIYDKALSSSEVTDLFNLEPCCE